MKKFYGFTAVLFGLLLTSFVYGANIPAPTNYVVDQTGKLTSQNISEMCAIADSLAKSDGPEVAVVLVESISPETIESYAIKLAEKWKVGKKSKNNGVILIVAKQERKIRIEVGYGLESVLPDAKAGQIISKIIGPKLKSGDWDGGVRGGFDAIVSIVKG